MKKISGYYDTIYKNEKEIEYAVTGAFTSMPGDTEEVMPGTDLIFFDFRITEITGDGFKPFPIEGAGYIRFNDEQWQVGDVLNQRFSLNTSPSLNRIKDAVVAKYLSLLD